MNVPHDKGARFRKCDFQVHSLRDAQWSGPFDPATDRQIFAEALVADCRRKGIQAIAITDHHDLCMWKIARAAAQSEKKSDATPFPQNEQLVVFPGVELTLARACPKSGTCANMLFSAAFQEFMCAEFIGKRHNR